MMPTDIFTISRKEGHVFDVGARRIAPINEPEEMPDGELLTGRINAGADVANGLASVGPR